MGILIPSLLVHEVGNNNNNNNNNNNDTAFMYFPYSLPLFIIRLITVNYCEEIGTNYQSILTNHEIQNITVSCLMNTKTE
jgi:hypothetical protein